MKSTSTNLEKYFIFPQVRILFEGKTELSNQTLLFLAGGRVAEKGWLSETMEKTSHIWAIDSGADSCNLVKRLPEKVIGDFDSIDKNTLNWLRKNDVSMDRYPPEKDLTDLQIAMKSSIDVHPGKPVIVSGCWGGRFDHNWSNLYSMVWANRQGAEIRCMADEKELLFLIGEEEQVSFEFSGDIPSAVSLIPLGDSSGITTKGLKWALDSVRLTQGHPYSISNELEDSKKGFSVYQEKGWLGVYMTWMGES